MSLEELNQELKEQNLIGYWTIPNTSTGFREPEPSFAPFLWKWRDIRAALDKATEFIRPEEAFRRFIGYQHPAFKMARPPARRHFVALCRSHHRRANLADHELRNSNAAAGREVQIASSYLHGRLSRLKGSGTTYIGDQRFDWQQGDSFVLPLWHWHSHENSSKEPAILFSINDRPALEALGLFREETQA